MKKINLNIVIIALLVISTMLLSVAYAAFSTELTISGEAVVHASSTFGITDVALDSITKNAYEIYNVSYTSETINVNISLPQKNSTLTYIVEFYNNSDTTYYISEIVENIYNNENIIYEIVNIDEIEILSNSLTTFEIIFSNDVYDSDNTSLTAELELVLDSGQTFANYIIALSETQTDISHQTFEVDGINYDAGYRYEGSDPANYISFNNEIWRVVGVVDTEVIQSDSSIEIETIVEIMKFDSIATIGWDSGKSNNWPESELYIGLNNDYLYSVYEDASISSFYLSYLEEVVWYLGGIGSTDYQTSTVYDSYLTERSDTVKAPNPVSTEAYVGLIYVSDYGFSADSTTCDRSTAMYSFGVTGCYNQSWIYNGEKIKTIVPRSSSTTTSWIINTNGSVGTSSASVSADIHPCVYLDASVYVVSGDGSISNPYSISM